VLQQDQRRHGAQDAADNAYTGNGGSKRD